MSAHVRMLDAAGAPVVASPFHLKFNALAVVTALILLLASCTEAPRAPVAGPDPADPRARVPPVDYRSTIGAYKSQRPVEPTPWVEQNERVAPAPKSGQ